MTGKKATDGKEYALAIFLPALPYCRQICHWRFGAVAMRPENRTDCSKLLA